MKLISNLISWLTLISQKIITRFRKRKQEQVVRERIIKAKKTSQEKVQSIIEEKVRQEEPISIVEVTELAETQTATELKELIVQPLKIRKRIFDLVEIEKEVTALNRKLIDLQIKQKQIEPIHFPQNYKTDKDIEKLEHILQKHDNKQNLTLSTSAIYKLKSRFGQFDKFLQDRLLVKIYRIREEKRRKEEETKKQEVKELISSIAKLINQNNLQEAQTQINKTKNAIIGLRSNDQKKLFLEKLEPLKTEIRDKQIEQEAKRQAEELKKQQEEAERRRLAEDAKREEEKQRRVQAELIRKQQEEAQKKKEEDKKQALQGLLAKKSNWQEFLEVLRQNGIIKLYHFTDRANIPSIKSNKGLFSWHYCDTNNILIPKTGGDPLSRELDKRHRLHDYVRLSFCNDHPMQYRLSQSGYNLIVLEVSIDVAFFENTRFSDINAADSGHQQGATIDDLKRVRFSATKRKYLRKDDPDFKHHQAEVMVKTWIPIEFITNINQF